METIGAQSLMTFVGAEPDLAPSTCRKIRHGTAHQVRNYMELATKVAALQFENRDYVLLFRGQPMDTRNHARNTTLKPKLLRHPSDPRKIPDPDTLAERFAILTEAEKFLVREYGARGLRGRRRLERQRILRWSILQHYEICDTPLLDVTQSLRVAASFASHGVEDFAYVFVLGVPHISGAVTASAEAGLQVVRLASVCPPSAVRPHIQEGFLLGEYPEFSSVEQKELYKSYEVDFGRRLIAKFRFKPNEFWDRRLRFPRIPEDALYPPPHQDPMCDLAAAVKAEIA